MFNFKLRKKTYIMLCVVEFLNVILLYTLNICA